MSLYNVLFPCNDVRKYLRLTPVQILSMNIYYNKNTKFTYKINLELGPVFNRVKWFPERQ